MIGVITDSNGVAQYELSGTWDDKIFGAKILACEEQTKGKPEYKTDVPILLWQRRMRP